MQTASQYKTVIPNTTSSLLTVLCKTECLSLQQCEVGEVCVDCITYSLLFMLMLRRSTLKPITSYRYSPPFPTHSIDYSKTNLHAYYILRALIHQSL